MIPDDDEDEKNETKRDETNDERRKSGVSKHSYRLD